MNPQNTASTGSDNSQTKTQRPPQIDGYSWYHRGRKGKGGRGVGTLIRDNLIHQTEEVDMELEEDIEII